MHLPAALLLLVSLTLATPDVTPTIPDPNVSSFQCSSQDTYIFDAAYAAALKAGVDPFGDMPTDYEYDTGDYIAFEKGSDFALWAAARGSLGGKGIGGSGLDKRLPGDLNLILWNGPLCSGGSGQYIYKMRYGIYSFNPPQINHSIQITGGSIDPDLWRVYLKGTSCNDDLNWYVYGGIGCVKNLPAFTCVEMRNGPDTRFTNPLGKGHVKREEEAEEEEEEEGEE
ncbi:hypothetical protein K440DRAFT_659387 [Wilcoxina mikolae CBS 423.85]|nr:hypothetical protein K440DRAFT_659387 [Wilcoxina mikolae CBS 423.85]